MEHRFQSNHQNDIKNAATARLKAFLTASGGTNRPNLRQQLKGQSLLPALLQLSEFFVFTVTIGNCNTMQSSRMSIMSVSKKSDNSENQTKHCMIQFANNENLLRSSRCLSFYQFIFSTEKKNLQKVLVVVIGELHDMMVKCHLLRRKNDVICVRHEMKMKRNLMRQTNRCGSFRIFPTKMVRYIGHTSFLKRKSIFSPV